MEVYNLSSLIITAGNAQNGYVGYYAINVYTLESGKSNLLTQDDYIFYKKSVTYCLIGYTGNDTVLSLPTLIINGETVSYSIYQYAFYNNTKITSVTIPDSVTSIGSYAFSRCTSLTSVYYSGTASEWADISFGNATANSLFYAGNLYLNGTLATDITIEDITIINAYAFQYCTSLTSVTIGDSVTSIGDYAFAYCSSITSITIPDGVTSLSSGLFCGCSSLVSITLPFIGSSASATSASSSTLFGYIFGTGSYNGGTATTQYYSSSDYTTYYIPSTLTTVTITGGNILYGAFYDCTSLTSVTIPNSVTSIGEYAFYNCTSLTSITIGSEVTSIGSNAFRYCYKLVEVYNLSSLTITSESTDNGYVGYYVLYIYTSADAESKLLNYGDYTFYCDDNGSYYLLRYNGNETELTLPTLTVNGETVSYAIYQYAFYENTKITNVIFCNSVTAIGNYAFYYCSSLESIILPDSITTIGDYAFQGCSTLTELTIGNGVTSIGYSAFQNCSWLKSVTFANTSGWYVTTTESETSGTTISSSDLSSVSTAATYLRNTNYYCKYYWYRSESQ